MTLPVLHRTIADNPSPSRAEFLGVPPLRCQTIKRVNPDGPAQSSYRPRFFAKHPPPAPRHKPGAGVGYSYSIRPVLGQRSAVDYEAIPHVTAHHAIVGLFDLLHLDHLDIRDDPVLCTEIEHLLSFGDSADQ